MVFNKCNKNCYTESIGPKGDKGPSGPKGCKGDKGNIGPIGDTGDTGNKGPSGEKGEKGSKGDVGADGDNGPAGDKGLKGPKGPTGLKGDTGDIGPSGQKGPKGLKGLRGASGDTGARGLKGPIGDVGDRGEDGDIGPSGDTGPIGNIGFPGFPGEKGNVGPKGLQGDRGPVGETGISGGEGVKGSIGDSGKKSQAIPLPGQIIMKKVLKYIKEQNFPCYVAVGTPLTPNLPGIGGLSNTSFINKIELDSVFFTENIVVPIENIQTVSVVYTTQNQRDQVVNDLQVLFNKIMDCSKNAPSTVPLNSIGEPQETGDLSIDYEYFVECTCNQVNGCSCIAKKIDLCRYAGYEGEVLNKKIEIANGENKIINKIITQRGEDFTDIGTKITPFVVGPKCISSVLILHSIDYMLQGRFETRYIWSLVNLDKVSAIEFR